MTRTATHPDDTQETKRTYRRRSVEERLAIHLDRRLLRLLQHGRPAVDPKSGLPLEKNGQPIMIPPTAADVAAAVKRLDQLRGGEEFDPQRYQELLELEEGLKSLQHTAMGDEQIRLAELAE